MMLLASQEGRIGIFESTCKPALGMPDWSECFTAIAEESPPLMRCATGRYAL